jgi:uncharacterized RDD family membrane protein YckC
VTAATTPPDPTAVLGRRILAHIIDTVVYAAAFLIPAVLLTESRDFAPGETLDRLGQASNGDLLTYWGSTVYTLSESDWMLALGIAAGVFFLSTVLVQGLTGRTLGKFVTGIRTVNADGNRPGILRALVRSLSWIIDGIPSFAVPIVGGIIALVTTGRRRLGDLLGGTYVVHRSFAGTPILQPDETADDEAAEASDPTPDEAPATAFAPTPSNDDVEDAPAVADDHAASEADPEPEAESESESEAESGDEPSEPTWDADRKAYISYDPRRGGWLQHDTETGEWGPISEG